jgi:zinc protease
MHIKTTTHEHYALAEITKPHAATATLYITADCFSENTPKQAALLLLYTDLLLSGSGTYSREEFQHKLDELGSNISVSASEGRITVTMTSLADKLRPTLTLLEVLLTKPAFKASEQKRAVQTLKNSLELFKENARGIALSALRNILFSLESRHFDVAPAAIDKALMDISPADLKRLHGEFLNAYWTISIGGSEASLKIALQSLKKLKQTSVVPLVDKEILLGTDNTARQVLTHEVKSKQNIELSIGGHMPLTLTDSDLPAFLFGLAVLGKWGGFAGRLMSTVREKEGLTYTIYARADGITTTEIGYWRILTFFAPKDVVKGITSTLREITTIVEKGITKSEYERFKTILKTGETLVFDSLNNTTGLVHTNLVSGLYWETYQAFRLAFQTVTQKEINTALKKYLNPQTLVISAAGPIANIEKDLASFASKK